jgi:hypothetical protein
MVAGMIIAKLFHVKQFYAMVLLFLLVASLASAQDRPQAQSRT